MVASTLSTYQGVLAQLKRMLLLKLLKSTTPIRQNKLRRREKEKKSKIKNK
jgi:hypothetical protein